MIHARHAAVPLLILPVDQATQSTEADLVRRAQQQDMAAFTQLYHQHVGRVHALCRRMTGDIPHAEELTQTVFVTLWDKLPLFRGESAFTSWLHRFTVNTVLMDFRSTHRREARVFGAEDPAVFETPVAPRTGLRLDLEQAIATLPPRARVVFVLHDVEGYTHEEIAGLLGLETGTSKAQLHRARQLLQEALR